MKHRSPAAVLLLPFITLGIYSWYWAVKTKGEMNKLGESIPTAWIWLIPIVGSIWWYWKYSEGVEHVTKEKMSGVLAFVLLFLLGFIGQAIIQNEFNGVGVADAAPAPGTSPQPAPSNPGQPAPDNSFGGPVAGSPPATSSSTTPTISASPAIPPSNDPSGVGQSQAPPPPQVS